MRAVRLHAAKDLRVETIDPPAAPAPGEVTLEVTAAGICGSDLHNYATGAWITRAPSVAGHEFTGIITATGHSVSHVAVGDRVIVDSRHTCGTCAPCRAGRSQVCDNLGFLGEVIDGGFATAVTLPARNVMRAAPGVPDRHLAMAEPISVALHALRRLDAPAHSAVLVTGCGPIGGLVALLASRAGHKASVVDRNATRASLVAKTISGTVVTLEEAAARGFRHAIDTTGNSTVIAALVEAIEGCGRLALVGIGRAMPVIDPVKLVEREITLLGCHAFGNELAEVNTLLPALGSALDAFITEEIPLEAVPDAYTRHLAGQVNGLKTIIRCKED
ncbi:zinc-dependent alcohol dehydrogenase [Antarcticimicrobium sediminis]|uniref:Dehydrogenase n=1 Tax=Antarcticimicrobium sediminis TaxID=2546227 RepID=A0A4V2Z6X7_9RHOB|nr:alcohol dehydrogenase catalytic domain-containing protein [Antarcticimicrobium sediminis]TDE34366.1 dehydrogenase [Antarcticimicrobium sediminis]